MTRQDRARQRPANPGLAIIQHVKEVRGNGSATCCYYGTSWPTYYTWLRRYEEEGSRGLEDRSSAPDHMLTATSAEVVEKILWPRRHYHFGPEKISMYLQGYHDVTIRVSGVWRIPYTAGIGRLPASQLHKRTETRWRRYDQQRPGHQLQVGVKFIEPLGQAGKARKYYQYTAIDDCTRLRVLRAQPRNNQKTAIEFIDYVLA